MKILIRVKNGDDGLPGQNGPPGEDSANGSMAQPEFCFEVLLFFVFSNFLKYLSALPVKQDLKGHQVRRALLECPENWGWIQMEELGGLRDRQVLPAVRYFFTSPHEIIK
jgi:hypothetical protein